MDKVTTHVPSPTPAPNSMKKYIPGRNHLPTPTPIPSPTCFGMFE